MKSNTLKKFLKENATGENLRYTKSEKRAFLEACRQYGNYKESFVKSEEIRQKVEEIGWLVDTAENMTLQETENWFDGVTVQRHMKQLKEAYKILQKTAGELRQSQQRFESAYDDIGTVLGKYYEV
jgi:hypothetical protein